MSRQPPAQGCGAPIRLASRRPGVAFRLTATRGATTMMTQAALDSGPRPSVRNRDGSDATPPATPAPGGSTVRGACELKRFARRCARPSAGTCQYCGRAFCSDHGVILDDGQEICSRSRCQRKRIDLEKHLRYKAFVRQRNVERQCGVPACQSTPTGQCSRCRGFFCSRHLANRDMQVREGRAWARHPASMCEHCWRRRPLWSQL